MISLTQGTMTRSATLVALVVLAAGLPPLAAQEVMTRGEQVISVAKGKSALVRHDGLARVTIADPAIAEPVVLSPTELLINGRAIGTTTLIVWRTTGEPVLSTVEVVADVEGISRQIASLFPGVDVQVTAVGNNVIISGVVPDPTLARRVIEIAKASGATVVNNLQGPSAAQILLQVRIAEVSQRAVQSMSTAIGMLNPQRLPNAGHNVPLAPHPPHYTLPHTGGSDVDLRLESLSDGLVRLFLMGANDSLDVIIKALRGQGEFRSLAEPNLLSLEGQEASFLAGGEFPFPVVQGTTGTVTIVWKEFGVRLKFTPNVTTTGAIRLLVEPEVSALDFANGLTFGGFRVPSVLTRRAKTEVELGQGQHLAIAGLVDNTITDNVTKIPFLGDIPILGAFFRSKDAQQNKSELLVIVTPRVVLPSDTPPPVPTGEPDTWNWMRGFKETPTSRPQQN